MEQLQDETATVLIMQLSFKATAIFKSSFLWITKWLKHIIKAQFTPKITSV